ncbi:DNA topoisomerase VI subunit B [Pyrococcus furiosus DSM 3638]|uniref:Type 2 DNA topoisomerase 6 subunit B n=3 Tax=Pyrococcus furiosus TaxID=2261 RepID=TOP6B_PYRFU|nr:MULTISPECIES: DNA topoisomerase VI subunit B [Pyrococcus]Q8U0K8.1 RecName: Full=Type 2 DNA topoisomerase 6 subunit B; AltName: Full=Type II DNA topoisomerase VI subunit B; Short=TopoVI-B [Pyrococcus furiosus DSM 3638]AAL81703.1 DNA topoisomerase VI, subunit b [Pyrococcus furiosus DSM 3638]AFN04361.1 DNA topoisomerase VI subunit B [Pyrococcus furiosus COM1]MDK2869707.1 topoisomerase subunit [Pyrococcus sp.]QEK79202.1 DNA topoisomerase VI subunit B [Pyrococcus furiosus DSM 3638]
MAEARDLFKEFKVQSVSEFFRRNAAMLGYTGSIRSLTTVIHEAVTNSLDACEEAGILPYVRVEIEELGKEHYKVIVEDNGPGIPEDYIPHVFGKMLAGTKAHRNIQSRGQQGIGISGAVMFAQITSGKATRVITSTGDDEIVEAWVKIDVQKNEGKIVKKIKHPNPKRWRGTRIELEVKNVKYVRSKQGVYWYLKLTAIANPHAHIELVEPDGKLIVFPRSSEDIPEPPVEMKPHPKGVMTDDVYTMAHRSKRSTVRRFLVSEFSRISDKKVDELVLYIAALRLINREVTDQNLKSQLIERLANGEVEKVLKSFGRKWKKVVEEVEKIMEKPPEKLTWHEAEEIVEAFKLMKFLAPPTYGLRPIGEENIEKGLSSILRPEFVTAVTRPPKVYSGGIPFQVEVGIAYGGEITNSEILRYANRVPLLFDAGSCVITSAVRSIDWRRYRVESFDNAPLVVLVNVVSVHVPYTSTGKQSIASIDEIYNEIRLALMEAARRLAAYLGGKYRRLYQIRRKKIFEKYLPEIARSLHILTGEPEEKIKEYFLRLIESKITVAQEGVSEVEVEEGEA